MKRFTYLFLEVVWFLPVIIAQWLVAPQILRAKWKAIPLVALPIAAYLTVKDKVALKDGTWTISAESSTGLKIDGVPIEEAVFFLLTSWVSAQGMIMLTDERSPEILHKFRRLLPAHRGRARTGR